MIYEYFWKITVFLSLFIKLSTSHLRAEAVVLLPDSDLLSDFSNSPLALLTNKRIFFAGTLLFFSTKSHWNFCTLMNNIDFYWHLNEAQILHRYFTVEYTTLFAKWRIMNILSDCLPWIFNEIGATTSFSHFIKFLAKFWIEGVGNLHSSLSKVNIPFVLLWKRSK